MKKKGYISLFLIFSVLAVTLIPHYLFAIGSEIDTSVPLYQEGEFEVVEVEPELTYDSGNDPYAAATEYICAQLEQNAEEIFIGAYNVKTSEFVDYFRNLINTHPELFNVASNFSYKPYSNVDKMYSILPTYSMTNEEYTAARVVFDEGTGKILSEIDYSMNDVQKALTVHDALCDIATYPDLGTFDESTGSYSADKLIYHNAYGIFYDGNAVCQGYALAYIYLMNQLGIPCEYVASDTINHGWNKIKIDGNWYNVDVTWDDLDYGVRKTIRGSVKHNFFMKSDSFFVGEGGHFHYDGETHSQCDATDTSYDSYFWNGILSRIYAVGGDYYYVKNTSGYNGRLVKRTVAGAESYVGPSFIHVTGTTTSKFYDKDGNEYNESMSNFYAKPVYLDNRFYITTYYGVISVNLEGKDYDIDSFSTYFRGFSQQDGQLVYQVAGDSTYTEVTMEKLVYYNNSLTQKKGVNYNNYPDINYDEVVNAKDYVYITRGN